jgi:hypothetical protein
MELLDDGGQMEACFGLFGYSANLDLDRCTVCAKCAIGSEFFWAYLIELLGDVVEVEACFALLGEGVNLVAK